MNPRWARPRFAATFVLVVVELVITCAVTAGATWVDRRLPER